MTIEQALAHADTRGRHYTCEDCWYSCPESGECCDGNATGCTCGGTTDKEAFDALATEIRRLVGRWLRLEVMAYEHASPESLKWLRGAMTALETSHE